MGFVEWWGMMDCTLWALIEEFSSNGEVFDFPDGFSRAGCSFFGSHVTLDRFTCMKLPTTNILYHTNSYRFPTFHQSSTPSNPSFSAP